MWRDRQIDFHQKTVNQFLTRFWSGPGHVQASRVFVPLCGKSLDMIWLAKQGHEVIGVELSPVAVKAFFNENHLKPIKRRVGNFTLWKHDRISILCGDYFSLSKAILGHIDTVYDRSALTALPEDIRKRYVEHLQHIVPQTTNIFLLTIEDVDDYKELKQDACIDEEIAALYADAFDIDLVHVDTIIEADPKSQVQLPIQVEYKVYRLSGKVN